MRPWLLGNTTVRSPFRLRDGLVALATSPLQGNLRGKDQEIAFRHLLGEHGIVELGDDATYSVGRKWRSALCKLGFLFPEIPSGTGIPQSDVGPLDMITPNGWRLVRAENVPAMQECFLRAMAAHVIPSPSEKDYKFEAFSPLRHTLNTLLSLEKATGESALSFIEMAVIVQLTNGADDVSGIVDNILELRGRRAKAVNKKQFDRQERETAAQVHGYQATTFNDYADTNYRYLKATGLVHSKGRGISLIPERRVFIERFVDELEVPSSDKGYYTALCNGATLPTDNKDSALVVLADLVDQLKTRDIPFDVNERQLDTPADIAVVRHELEGVLSERKEEEYASRQSQEWEEIHGYMELINTRRRSKTLPNGEEIEVPQAEAPAYFEWILWRAFLAINNLTNKPYEARRFKIDQDFLPVGTAPGNGPDLIFEFEDYVLVVEVTLTTNSRQEAAEGEPVRRHVADIVSYWAPQGKPVYGLFIANRIDSNTAETFRIGVWYSPDDSKMRLDIIPLTLEQFGELFEALFLAGKADYRLVRGLLDECGTLRPSHEAPLWKSAIASTVRRTVDALTQ